MISERGHARHLAQLGFLQRILEGAGLSVQIVEKTELVPLHVLLAGFRQDEEGRDRILHVTFLPLDDEQLESLQLLQLYYTFPFQLRPENRAQVAELLLSLNAMLAIGHFGINDQQELHLRYTYALSASETFREEETLDLVELFVNCCDLFGPAIEQVANGTATAEEAVRSLS